jgi:hypothetical protein
VQPLVQWKSNEYYTTLVSVCVCSLRYAACNAHAPYCHIWPAPSLQDFSAFSHKQHDFRKRKFSESKVCVLIFSSTFVSNISPPYLITGKISDEKLLSINCVFRVSLQLLSETVFILRRIQRDIIINLYWYWIFWAGFRRILKYQISWKSFQWEPSCSMRTDGRTDGQTWRS